MSARAPDYAATAPEVLACVRRLQGIVGLTLRKLKRSVMTNSMRIRILMTFTFMLAMLAATLVTRQVLAQKPSDQQKPSSFMPVVEEPFDVVRSRDKAAKASVMAAIKNFSKSATTSVAVLMKMCA